MAGKQKRPNKINTAKSKNTPSSGRPKSGDAKRPSAPRSGGNTIVSRAPSSAPKPSSSTPRPKQAGSTLNAAAVASQVSAQSDTQAARLSSTQARMQRVAGLVTLGAIFDQLEDLTSQVSRLVHDIDAVRARGYRYGRSWEDKMATLQTRWPQQQREANRMLRDQQRVLQNAAGEVQRLLFQAERNFGLIDTVDNRLWALENQANEAQRSVRGLFDSTEQEIRALLGEVNRARFLLDSLDSAAFDLNPGEHGIATCTAQWVSDHQQPDGMLFLTNQRVIFEQREERVTKKVLFIATEKQLIQEKLWDAPVGAVVELEAEDKKSGFLGMGRQELLSLRFPERTRELPSDVTLQLKDGATNEEWRNLIRQAKSGQIDADMFGAPPPQEQLATEVATETESPPVEAPTRCPSCNAMLPQVYKGMTQVVCEYCGTVVNV